MKVLWRKSAVESLVELDEWRKGIELETIAEYIMSTVNLYFNQQYFSIHIPGRQVIIQEIPVELRMVLIAVGKSDPYKVFYRIDEERIEIFLVRHPHQKPL